MNAIATPAAGIGAAMRSYNRETRAQWAGAIFLALVAGYLDGYGLLFLKTYVSFMSGNTTSTGVMIGSRNFHAALSSAIAILCFVAGSFCGNLLSDCRVRHSHRVSFILIAGLLVTVAGMEVGGLRNVLVEIALLSSAMGIVNPALTKIGAEPVSLTFMTGTLSRIGGHLASAAGRKPLIEAQGEGDSHLVRAGVEASVWAGFLTGALLSGLLTASFRAGALLPPCAVMIALSLFSESPPQSVQKAVPALAAAGALRKTS